MEERKLTQANSPELHAQPDPLDNTLEPHNSWVVRTWRLSCVLNEC